MLASLTPTEIGAIGLGVVKRRILIADDDKDASTMMALVLTLIGNEVRVAQDGIEAVEIAESFLPDVVLMDIGMPRLNGHEATRRIRAQPWGREMVVIAVTGCGQATDHILSKEAGCDAHLVKPFNPLDLETFLHRLAGGGQSNRLP